MMGKMGLGLLGFVGKSLLSGGGAAGSVLSAVGKGCAGGAGKGGGGSSVLSLLGGKSGGGQGCGGGRGGQGGKGRGRNQNAAPLEEAFAALLDKDRAATGTRLETASRPDLAPFTPSADQIIDVRAGEAPVAGEGPLDARREAALEALMRHIASFTDGRVRLRHEAFKEQAIHAALRQALEQTGQFTAVEFKAATGSVLLRYDAGRLSRADFLEAAMPLGLFLATC